MLSKPPHLKFALDLGANSIGWAVFSGTNLIDLGVRVFPDSRNPRDRSSLAVARRLARSMRKRRDRYLLRRRFVLAALTAHSLFPEDEAARKALEKLNPHELRAKALDTALAPFEIGRALFHLNQRRGFQSNRKTDKGQESGKIKTAIKNAAEVMAAANVRTLGELAAKRHAANQDLSHRPQNVRVRLTGQGAKAEYELYPSRALIEDEFEQIWAAQAPHHPELMTEAAKDAIKFEIFHQRPLKPVPVGKCTFYPEQERCPRSHPLAQRFRLLQTLNDLKIISPDQSQRALQKEERDLLLRDLLAGKELKFNAIRKKLRLDSNFKFSLEREKTTSIKGDESARILSSKKVFGKAWAGFDAATRQEILLRLNEEEDEAVLLHWLQTRFGLDEPQAEAVSAADLPDGHVRLGVTALAELIQIMEPEVVPYWDAATRAFGSHSVFGDGEILDRLPYYGQLLDRHTAFGTGDPDDPMEKQLGKIANPTVHVALKQIQHVVNALLDRHGHPDEIIIELTRELKKSVEEQKKIEKRQAENQRENDRRALEIEPYASVNAANLLKMRLWEEMEPRLCVYTGKPISLRQLLSDEVEVDHILPLSKSLDNSPNNKVVCFREANRLKRNQTPHEAFGADPGWDGILARIAQFNENKKWRFAEDAMDQWEQKQDFLDRHLVDTQYISRLAREYLSAVCEPRNVRVTPGRLTAMLRGKWGLNRLLASHNQTNDPSKNRNDHRHHGLDAFVIGMVSWSLLQKIATAAANAEYQDLDRDYDGFPPLPEKLRDQLLDHLDRMVVSHKIDHGAPGKLHNDTAYGIVSSNPKSGLSEVVHRRDLSSFKAAKDLDTIRDDKLRNALKEETYGLSGADFQQAIRDYTARTHVRRVRVVENLSVIPIKDPRTGKPYKAYKGDANHRFEVYRTPDGKWGADCISNFDAAQPNHVPRWKRDHPAAKLMLKLHKDDPVAIGTGAAREILRVVKFSGSSVVLAPCHEGGALKNRDSDKDDPFKYRSFGARKLKELGARRIHVDVLGRVQDGGPRE